MKTTFLIAAYNEEDALPSMVESFLPFWKESDARVLFVNDGSIDGTLEILRNLSKTHDFIGYLELSRNFGKEQAIAAGLSVLPDDRSLVIMDADGQHSLNDVKRLLEHLKANEHLDIVFGVRQSREYQNPIDRFFSNAFYKLTNSMVSTPLDGRLGDFFVASSNILPALKSFQDSRLFWKGVYSWIGFKRDVLPITIEDRAGGKSKFNLWKRVRLAIDGVIWLTKAPLFIFAMIGLLMAASSFFVAVYFLLQYLFVGIIVPGFYTIAVLQAFVGGMIMLSLGVISLYLSVIFENTSSRPAFIISPRSELPKW